MLNADANLRIRGMADLQISRAFLQLSGLTVSFSEWDNPTMIAATTDEKRRLTMPKELPPKSVVTIQQVNEDSWLITRQKPNEDVIVVALPKIHELPSDPEWEAIEKRIVKRTNRNLPPFEE